MHQMVISCSSVRDVERRQTYGGASPPTAHSRIPWLWGNKLSSPPLFVIRYAAGVAKSAGCTTSWDNCHTLYTTLTRTIRGGGTTECDDNTGQPRLSKPLAFWLERQLSHSPKVLFPSPCSANVPTEKLLSPGCFKKYQGRLRQVVLLLKEEVGRERDGERDRTREKRVVTKILQNLESRKRSWRRKCPEEVYAFSLARTHGCPVSRRQTTRAKICAGQAPFPETGWVLKRERERHVQTEGERELGQPGGETFHRPLCLSGFTLFSLCLEKLKCVAAK